jgi:hypothetical protein
MHHPQYVQELIGEELADDEAKETETASRLSV